MVTWWISSRSTSESSAAYLSLKGCSDFRRCTGVEDAGPTVNINSRHLCVGVLLVAVTHLVVDLPEIYP